MPYFEKIALLDGTTFCVLIRKYKICKTKAEKTKEVLKGQGHDLRIYLNWYG
jgi:hypothetical protein